MRIHDGEACRHNQIGDVQRTKKAQCLESKASPRGKHVHTSRITGSPRHSVRYDISRNGLHR